MHEPAFWYRPSSWISRLLMPLGALYGLVAGQRLQRQGFDAGIPVLCVGNYHVGGAGKTPMVLALTKMLRDLGETPVVLSRGYGGRLRGPIKVDPERHAAGDGGDEALMLARTGPAARAPSRGMRASKTRPPPGIPPGSKSTVPAPWPPPGFSPPVRCARRCRHNSNV